MFCWRMHGFHAIWLTVVWFSFYFADCCMFFMLFCWHCWELQGFHVFLLTVAWFSCCVAHSSMVFMLSVVRQCLWKKPSNFLRAKRRLHFFLIDIIRVRFRNGCNGVPRACEWKRVESFVFGSWSSCSVTGFRNRAGVSKFYFRCFQNATGCSSPRKAFPELRIELTTTLEHARGR